MRFFLFFLPLCIIAAPHPFQQFHEAHYKAGWDIDWSPYAGGEDILFATRVIERAEGYLVRLSPTFYYSKSASSRFWRIFELFFIWLPLNELAVTVQHEIFGHGYRIRTLDNAHVNGYDFDAPLPYGPGGAATKYSITPSFTTTEDAAVSMAGVEATAILAQLTKFKWLESNRIDPRQAVLYLLAENDLNLYIGTLKLKQAKSSGHDITAYIRALNKTYTSHSISGARLRSLSWINLADPFIYYSIYAWFHYISSGKETKIPMIPIGRVGYLPNLRLGLTPFGPEVFLENYFLDGKKPFYAYITGGHHSDNNYGGAGFYVPHIYDIWKWSFGARVDGWYQPKLLLKPDETDQHAMRWGVGGSAVIAWQGDARSGFEAELGYKSKGFLPGYDLLASPVVRLFYTLVF